MKNQSISDENQRICKQLLPWLPNVNISGESNFLISWSFINDRIEARILNLPTGWTNVTGRESSKIT